MQLLSIYYLYSGWGFLRKYTLDFVTNGESIIIEDNICRVTQGFMTPNWQTDFHLQLFSTKRIEFWFDYCIPNLPLMIKFDREKRFFSG